MSYVLCFWSLVFCVLGFGFWVLCFVFLCILGVRSVGCFRVGFGGVRSVGCALEGCVRLGGRSALWLAIFFPCSLVASSPHISPFLLPSLPSLLAISSPPLTQLTPSPFSLPPQQRLRPPDPRFRRGGDGFERLRGRCGGDVGPTKLGKCSGVCEGEAWGF